MDKTIYYFSIVSIVCTQISIAQNNFIEHDSLYYNNWVGEWYEEVDGLISNDPTFVVKRALYHSSFEEYWMGAGGNFSMAWRAWDTRTQSWGFAWMSTNGLFQNWEGKKLNGIWYMYKTFLIDNKEVLSRQAFILQNKTTLIRTSEHSRDNGKTWKLRFREKYRKQ